jgi:hypothetical protein
MHTGFQQQQPLLTTAAVRSVPTPQHGAHLELPSNWQAGEPAAVASEEKSFAPPPKS